MEKISLNDKFVNLTIGEVENLIKDLYVEHGFESDDNFVDCFNNFN